MFPEEDRQEGQGQSKKQTGVLGKRRLVMCLREAGKQDGRLYLATLAADRLLPWMCWMCVYGCPQQRAAADQAQAQDSDIYSTAPSHA